MALRADISNLLRQGGKIYISTNYDPDTMVYDAPTNANLDANIALIEGDNTFEQIAYFQNFNVSHTREDEQTTIFDDCDKGQLTSARFVPNFNFDLFGVNNFDLMQLIMSTAYLTVAGTPVVGATQDIVNPSGYLDFYKIANQNFDGSAVVVTAVSGSVDGALTLTTDYLIVQDGNGVYGIQFVSGGNITTLTQTFTITYNYTPAQSENIGYRSNAISIPKVLFKFVSCEDPFTDAGIDKLKTNTVYITNSFLNSDYVENFTNLAQQELQSSSLTFTVEKGGDYYHRKAVVNA